LRRGEGHVLFRDALQLLDHTRARELPGLQSLFQKCRHPFRLFHAYRLVSAFSLLVCRRLCAQSPIRRAKLYDGRPGISFLPMFPLLLSALLAAAPASTSRGGPRTPAITQLLAERIRHFHGELGLAAKDLQSGEVIAVHGDTRFPTASLIKVA